LSFPTIWKYRALLDSEGPDALAQMKEYGSKSQLDEKALKWLASAVRHSAKHHGIAAPG
jgi:hypothetical protein